VGQEAEENSGMPWGGGTRPSAVFAVIVMELGVVIKDVEVVGLCGLGVCCWSI